MSLGVRYTEVREITDMPGTVSELINGDGWDLLEVATRKHEVADNTYSDQIVYVIGHRADAQ